MKKLAITSVTALILLFMSYYILDYFELAFRVWAFWLWVFIIIVLSAAFSFSLLCLTVRQIKNKEHGIKPLLFVSKILGTALSALFFVIFTGIAILGIMLDPDDEIDVITENGKKYVVQKEIQDIGNGPYYEIKYDYVNFIVRGKEGYGPEGG